MFKISVNFTVKMIIERVLNKGEEGCRGWCTTEVVERGTGKWDKVSAQTYDIVC